MDKMGNFENEYRLEYTVTENTTGNSETHAALFTDLEKAETALKECIKKHGSFSFAHDFNYAYTLTHNGKIISRETDAS